jgi:hypothetical protein
LNRNDFVGIAIIKQLGASQKSTQNSRFSSNNQTYCNLVLRACGGTKIASQCPTKTENQSRNERVGRNWFAREPATWSSSNNQSADLLAGKRPAAYSILHGVPAQYL